MLSEVAISLKNYFCQPLKTIKESGDIMAAVYELIAQIENSELREAVNNAMTLDDFEAVFRKYGVVET